MSSTSMQAKITASFPGTTFIQLWRMSSAGEQNEWLRTMHANIHLLQTQPGFRSMSLHPSLDGRNVIVYAQWESEESLKAAVDLPEVKAARDSLDSHGEPDGALFTVESVSTSQRTPDGGMQIESGAERLTFVNVWVVHDREQQRELLSAMRDEVAAVISRRGSHGMAIHSSNDCKRIVVYAQWESLAAYNAAIANDPTAQESREKLARLGRPTANIYRVDSVNLPLVATPRESSVFMLPDESLLSDSKRKWAARSFGTRLVHVNNVTLHVAEAGHGDPILLLHGYPQSGEAWRFVAPELAKGHRVVIPDLRGMGLSEAAMDGYDLSNVAEDMHRLVVSLGVSKIKVVGHDWGGAVGAVYALRYPGEVTHLAFLESALAGAGFETLWDFSKPNPVFSFIPFLLMGGGGLEVDATAALLQGREPIFLHHLWATFTGDKDATPFSDWSPYVESMARPGMATASSSYYRAAYKSADQVRSLIVNKLRIPVLALAGEKGIGANHEGLVRAFAANLTANIVVQGAGHFLAEERPEEIISALTKFLAS